MINLTSITNTLNKNPVNVIPTSLTASIKSTQASVMGVDNGFKQTNNSVQQTNKSIQQANKSTRLLGGSVTDTYYKFRMLSMALKTGVGFVKMNLDASDMQQQVEKQLQVVMSQRMGTMDITPVLHLTALEQTLGVIGDEVQLAGAKQVATYLDQADSLNVLIPAMNNLAVANKGVNVSQNDMVGIGNMVGKVMQGQVGALTKAGITLTDYQKNVLQTGDELTRASMLANIITDNFGEMNYAMAELPLGKIKQMKNDFGDTFEVIGDNLKPAIVGLVETFHAALPEIQTVVIAMSKIFIPIIQIISFLSVVVLKVFSGISNFIQAHSKIISMALLSIALALLPVIAGFVVAGVQAIITGIQMFLAFLPVTLPILLVAGAIFIVIYALMSMGVTTEQILTFIGNLFGVMFVFLANGITNTINMFIIFAEFLYNFLNNPIGAIQMLFYNLAINVIGFASNMLHAMESMSSGMTTAFLKGINGMLSGLNWFSKQANKILAPFGKSIGMVDMLDTTNVHVLSDKLKAQANNIPKPQVDGYVEFQKKNYLDGGTVNAFGSAFGGIGQGGSGGGGMGSLMGGAGGVGGVDMLDSMDMLQDTTNNGMGGISKGLSDGSAITNVRGMDDLLATVTDIYELNSNRDMGRLLSTFGSLSTSETSISNSLSGRYGTLDNPTFTTQNNSRSNAVNVDKISINVTQNAGENSEDFAKRIKKVFETELAIEMQTTKKGG